MSLLLRIYILLSVTALTLTAADSADGSYLSHFQAGNEAYEKADYETAKTEFTTALKIDETPAARQNLGLTYFQLDQPAQAIWQLERALLLDPFNWDYREKRNLIRKQLGLPENPTTWYFLFSQFFPIQVWLIIATVSFWLLLAASILPVLFGRKVNSRNRLLNLFSLLILILSLTAIWLNAKTLRTGILIAEKTIPLNAAPATTTPESGFARPGERARVLNQHNDFYQIKTESSATGWISEDNFRLLVDN